MVTSFGVPASAFAVPNHNARDITSPVPPKTDIVNIVRRFMHSPLFGT